MAFVNLTPHVLNILTPSGSVTLPPSGRVLRASAIPVPAGERDGVPLVRASFGALELVDSATKSAVPGLPPIVPGTTYIVSGICLEAVAGELAATADRSGRNDFAAPGELVRDAAGRPVGCKGLRVL